MDSCLFLILLVVQSLPSGFSGAVEVNVTATVGQDSILPCFTDKGQKGQLTDVLWTCVDSSMALLVYRGERVLTGYEDKMYYTRIQALDPHFSGGDLSVVLKKVTIEDSGVYKCMAGFEDDHAFYEKSQYIRLTVTEQDSSRSLLLCILLPIILLLLLCSFCCFYYFFMKRKRDGIGKWDFKDSDKISDSLDFRAIQRSFASRGQYVASLENKHHSNSEMKEYFYKSVFQEKYKSPIAIEDVEPDLYAVFFPENHHSSVDAKPDLFQHSEKSLFEETFPPSPSDWNRDHPFYSCPSSPSLPSRSCHLTVVEGFEGSSPGTFEPLSQTKSSSFPSLRKGDAPQTTPTKNQLKRIMRNPITVI